ncbi:sigma-70 region 2 domain protein [Stigmatella aurantiaca DW4/3-1]|uniref:Sigma-70 region 2 domain protein n=1 Tax=Stigmatella aurantiaca (strain DW4/3-1) TaxID=378806 RepID=Q08VM4_STIAD|nr:sigma-70 region 2 domain protein [Stigmatella aurantiaca DW4/3-1]
MDPGCLVTPSSADAPDRLFFAIAIRKISLEMRGEESGASAHYRARCSPPCAFRHEGRNASDHAESMAIREQDQRQWSCCNFPFQMIQSRYFRAPWQKRRINEHPEERSGRGVDTKVRAKFMAEVPRVHAQVLARVLILVRGTGFRIRSMTPNEAARDLVQEAVMRALDGRRNWNPEQVPDLDVYLCETVRSIMNAEFRSSAMNTYLYEEDSVELDKVQALAEKTTPEDEHLHREQIRRRVDLILRATQNEKSLLALVEAIMDGCDKPTKVADQLGIPVEEVYNATRKLARRALVLEQQIEEQQQ